MKTSESGKKRDSAIRDLYQHLHNEQLKEAEENMQRYLELALRIYERIKADPEAYAQFKILTASNKKPNMHAKRSNSTPTSNSQLDK